VDATGSSALSLAASSSSSRVLFSLQCYVFHQIIIPSIGIRIQAIEVLISAGARPSDTDTVTRAHLERWEKDRLNKAIKQSSDSESDASSKALGADKPMDKVPLWFTSHAVHKRRREIMETQSQQQQQWLLGQLEFNLQSQLQAVSSIELGSLSFCII
jgi:hypothetical protein